MFLPIKKRHGLSNAHRRPLRLAATTSLIYTRSSHGCSHGKLYRDGSTRVNERLLMVYHKSILGTQRHMSTLHRPVCSTSSTPELDARSRALGFTTTHAPIPWHRCTVPARHNTNNRPPTAVLRLSKDRRATQPDACQARGEQQQHIHPQSHVFWT